MCEYRSRQTPDSMAARHALINLADTCFRIAEGHVQDDMDDEFLSVAKNAVDRRGESYTGYTQ